LSFCAITTSALAAELKKPSPSPSDALFDPGRVIQIEIRLDPKDWHALRISHPDLDENLVPIRMNYAYYRADVVIDGKLVKSVGVRKKGTWGSTARPSLKIKLDEYVKGQEFSGVEMLTLNNLRFDPTRAQQSMVYSLMNKAGAISPRSNLARVVVNGEDLGVYGQVESIDKRFIKRHFGDAKGDLYEGQYRADFTANMFRKIEHKWGPDDELGHIQKLMETLESPGPLALANVEPLVEIYAFLTFWAAEVLIGHGDSYSGNAGNYYVYRDAKPGKFSWFPWGADMAFEPNLGRTPIFKSVSVEGRLCRRLWEVPEIRERYRREMRRLLADVWDEKAMLAELDEIKRLAHKFQPLDTSKGTVTLGEAVRFLERRRKEVQAELDRPASDLPPEGQRDDRIWARLGNQPMQVEGAFSALIAEAFPTNFANYFGQGTATLHFTVTNRTQQPFTRFGAIAVLGKDLSDGNTIRIVAANAAGDLRWEIRFGMDSYRAPLVPGTRRLGLDELAVMAPVFQFQGAPGSRKTQSRPGPQNKGTLALTQVSTNLGGTIAGKFKINTTAFAEAK
jgi:hypothetical protein